VGGQNLGTVGGTGVKGISIVGEGVLGRSSTGPGVRGTSEGESETPTTSPLDSFGVDGVGRNGATGVRGITTGVNPSNGMSGVAVHGIAVEGLPSLAGFFEGFVLIQGGLTVSGPTLVTETLNAGAIVSPSKMFRIDHPLDPVNKYLIHTVVESPDMKNVYDGLVTLDAQGEATVELPEWFEVLNKDLRYQLTPIGAPEPNLHIAAEVSNNRFKIGGGTTGTKVSWQVTGIRKDHWAEAHRNPVEQDKLPEERGRYLHPELFGEGQERALIPGRIKSFQPITEHRRRVDELKRWIEADEVDARSAAK
jgi:hypothetical protein